MDDHAEALALFMSAGHKPRLNASGQPDDSALDIDDLDGGFGGHNGYACTVCGYAMCVWCAASDGFEVEKCEPRITADSNTPTCG